MAQDNGSIPPVGPGSGWNNGQQVNGGAPEPPQGWYGQQQTQQIPFNQQGYNQQNPYGQTSGTQQMPPQGQPGASGPDQPPFTPNGGSGPSRQGKAKKPATRGQVFVTGIVAVALGLALGSGVTYYTVRNAAGTASPSATSTQTVSGGGSQNVTIQASDESTSLSEAVAAKVSPSVVSVYVYAQSGSSSSYFGNGSSSGGSDSLYATGSGVIISADGYIITNAHVVADGTRYTVLINGDEVDCELVGSDPSSDIAVLKANATGLTPIEVGDSDAVNVGAWCMTLGSPYGLDQSASEGIVSAKYRSTALQSTSGVSIYANLIQTDAAINSGSSGGALVDREGKLIGITTLTTSSGSSIGFAIPSNYAYQIAQQLISTGHAYHAYLGISMRSMNSSLAQQLGVSTDSGAYVSDVTSGLAADKAGLKAGDIITKIDNTNITTSESLIMTVRTYSIGDTATITYLRDGQEHTAQVTFSSDEGYDTAGTTVQNSNAGSGSSGLGQLIR